MRYVILVTVDVGAIEKKKGSQIRRCFYYFFGTSALFPSVGFAAAFVMSFSSPLSPSHLIATCLCD